VAAGTRKVGTAIRLPFLKQFFEDIVTGELKDNILDVGSTPTISTKRCGL
jgi:hypothetical protein